MKIADLLNLLMHGYSSDTDIGMCYQYGKHVKLNIEIAKEYYIQAANNNEAKAYMQLSGIASDEGKLAESFYLKAKGYSIMSNWLKTVLAYENAVALNHALSMFELACIYQHGRKINSVIIINQDIGLACKWFRNSYLKGHAESLPILLNLSNNYDKAMLTLAQMYEAGEINHQINIELAIRFYELASVSGNLNARHRLGEIYETGAKGLNPNLQISHVHYLKAAKYGHKASLQALERITPIFSNPHYRLILAELYLSNFNEPNSALKHLKYLADHNVIEAIERIDTLIKQVPEYAYQLALVYKAERPFEESEKSYNYFKKAACENNTLAMNTLIEASENGSELAFCYLGEVYEYQSKWKMAIDCYQKAAAKNNSKAMFNLAQIFSEERQIEPGIMQNQDLSVQLDWLLKAANRHYKPAINSLLLLSEKNATAAVEIADLFESGEFGDDLNILIVINNLKIASKLKDVNASYRLGNIYECGLKEIKINLKESFKYYYRSAKLKHNYSLLALLRIIEVLNDAKYMHKLGLLYLEQFDNKLSAYNCFISADYKCHKESHQQLIKIGKIDANEAVHIAELYAAHEDRQFGYSNSLKFYAYAALKNDLEALKIIKEEADTENSVALFNLGYEYWFKVKEIKKSLDCCMLSANQKHEGAIQFLKTTKFHLSCYIYLAKKYENGDVGIDKNIDLAILFYQKAFNPQDMNAAFKLGELYHHKFLSNIISVENSCTKACEYFIIAAKLGRRDSLPILNNLAAVMTPEMKIEVGALYHDKLFNNSMFAKKWFQSSKNDRSSDAENQPMLLNNNSNTLFSLKKANIPEITPNSIRLAFYQ